MKLRRLSASLGLIGLIALLMTMFAAGAQAATPAPGYSQFAGCPSPAESPTTAVCLRSVVTSGHFKMGNKDVPITNPMTLSGGLDGNLRNFAKSPAGGLTPVKQTVPGGVIGLTGLDWLVNFLSLDGLKLYAVTELAGVPELGETLKLPIRVHLINPVLGNNCYVGSLSNPIVLNLTEETTSPPLPNKPISGHKGTPIFHEESGIFTSLNSEAVDNSFAAPGANGCVLTLFGFIPISINGLVNTASGLPAPAGTNETRQVMDMELVPVSRVYP